MDRTPDCPSHNNRSPPEGLLTPPTPVGSRHERRSRDPDRNRFAPGPEPARNQPAESPFSSKQPASPKQQCQPRTTTKRRRPPTRPSPAQLQTAVTRNRPPGCDPAQCYKIDREVPDPPAGNWRNAALPHPQPRLPAHRRTTQCGCMQQRRSANPSADPTRLHRRATLHTGSTNARKTKKNTRTHPCTKPAPPENRNAPRRTRPRLYTTRKRQSTKPIPKRQHCQWPVPPTRRTHTSPQ